MCPPTLPVCMAVFDSVYFFCLTVEKEHCFYSLRLSMAGSAAMPSEDPIETSECGCCSTYIHITDYIYLLLLRLDSILIFLRPHLRNHEQKPQPTVVLLCLSSVVRRASHTQGA